MTTTTIAYLATPDHAARSEQMELASGIEQIAARQTAEITAGDLVVSVTRQFDGVFFVIFGRWAANPFKRDDLVFEVSSVQPSTHYRSARGAARACGKWLAATA